MEFTRDGMAAAEMARRNFQELITPIIDELTSTDAKKGYVKSIVCGACVELAAVTGDNFEETLDELVAMTKLAYRETRHKTPPKPS